MEALTKRMWRSGATAKEHPLLTVLQFPDALTPNSIGVVYLAFGKKIAPMDEYVRVLQFLVSHPGALKEAMGNMHHHPSVSLF